MGGVSVGKKLLVVATLDTKGREADVVRTHARKLGLEPILMDIGVVGIPQTAPDIPNSELVDAAGYQIDSLIRAHDRPKAIAVLQEGGRLVANRLLQEGNLDGVIGVGGGTGTSVVSFIMRSLPFGLPKLIVSTMASRDVREYVGTKDIVMFHSVVDLLGFNDFIRLVLTQATGAICGMMEEKREADRKHGVVGVTAYGPTSESAIFAEDLLAEKGYQMMGFHTNGCGGMAMEQFIAEGLLDGVLDFTPHEIMDDIMNGYCKGTGPSRLETAGRMGIPMVFAPGGLDNIAYGPSAPMPKKHAARRIYGHDARVCVRTEPREMKKVARIIAERLNKTPELVYVLLPTKGWSEGDREGMPLFDPVIDQVFTDTLKKSLNPKIKVEEIGVHINDHAFTERAVDVLDQMIRGARE
jgi:uncharacterized protein (UPF0261 family)